jgi:hypothetical protein
MNLRAVVGVVLIAALTGGPARADETRDAEARRLYGDGRDAFEKQDYQHAYDSFRQSYLLSQRPELLFNMSSALKELGRPHDAAEDLRAYLRVVPNAPDRPAIEERILTLEESQRILDREHARTAPPPAAPETAAPAPATTTPPASAATSAPAATVEPSAATNPNAATATTEKPHRKRALVIGLVVGGAVVAIGLGVGLGIGLSRGPEAPTTSTFGTVRATP